MTRTPFRQREPLTRHGTRPEPSAQAERRQPPLAHTPEEAADAASVVGFFPGLDSQVTRSE
jgi:hypothetical protein